MTRRLDAPVDEDDLAAGGEELALMNLALAREAERYRKLYDSAPIPFMTTDGAGKVIEANTAACRLFEVDERFLTGKPLAAYVDPASRRAFRQWLLRVRRGDSVSPMTIRMRRRGGVAFEASLRASAATEGELLWALDDVTERAQSEARMWEMNRDLEMRVAIQTAELEAIVERMPIGLVVVDAELQSVRANRHARDLVGDGPEPFGDLHTAGVTVQGEKRPLWRALHGETIVSERYELVHWGERLVLEISAVPIRTEETITGAVLTFADVSEQNRRERADLEFVANAAHQIRTPITAIAAAVAALEAGAKHDDDARDRFILHIEDAVRRLASTAEALLTLSRIERGEIKAAATIVRIGRLLERLTGLTDGARTSVDCAPDVAAVTHEGLLQEALASLLDNALQHTTGAVRIRGWREGGYTYVEVADDGPGMDRATRGRALERFVSTGRGAGLGLSIAAAAVRAANGELRLEAGANGGTAARVRLTTARMVT